MKDPRHRVAIGLAALMLTVMLLDARPATVDEIYLQDPWEPGQAVRFEGIVETVTPVETSRGTLYAVDLATHWYDWPFIGLTALLNHGTFQGTVTDLDSGLILLNHPVDVGSHFALDTEFYGFDLNGIDAVGIRDTACIYPCLHVAMAQVMESISEVQGMRLHLVDEGEWGTYVVELIQDGTDDLAPVPPQDVLVAVNERAYPAADELSDFPITDTGGLSFRGEREFPLVTYPIDSIEDWFVLAATDFIWLGDAGESNGPGDAWLSPTGLLDAPDDVRFQDNDGDDLVGTGDIIQVRYPTVAGDDQRTVFLQVWRCADTTIRECGLASKLVLIDSDGPYERAITKDWTLWYDEGQAVLVRPEPTL